MRRFKKVPFEEDFKEFENDEQEKFAQRFDEVSEDVENFNLVLQEQQENAQRALNELEPGVAIIREWHP
ncbi:hypothetical protein ACE418_08495 [Megasphaera sp. WILCCON 0056]|uniref:hypothetical protein n=1 Tax=Megasphaera sp. WILCCON 0056 TaxID=3345340 RepID=UPI003A805405